MSSYAARQHERDAAYRRDYDQWLASLPPEERKQLATLGLDAPSLPGASGGAHNDDNWDAHGDMLTHTPLAKNVDRPVAGLLQDLKARGMLEDTLVVWTTEFGRTPFNATADARGREHHHWVFSSWMAGAGVRPGTVYGESDDHGIRVGSNPVHVHDFHATILHLMGFDHERLTYRHSGRDFRLTDVAGEAVRGILA